MKHFKNKKNNIYAFEADGSQDHLITDDMVEVTEAERDELIKQSEPELTYTQKRMQAYGTPAEQLEFITEHGLQAWQDKVVKIKQQYPKE